MDRRTPLEIAKALSELSIWEDSQSFNWGLVPQSTEFPYVGHLLREKEGPLKGRIMLFPGFKVFGDFVMSRQFPDYGVCATIFDIPHYSIVFPRDGEAQCAFYEPGFVPRDIKEDGDDPLFKSLASQTYGVLFRFESDRDIAKDYAKEQSILSRKEISENNWIDGPLRVPSLVQPAEERISFGKGDCEKAGNLPASGETWEVEFAMFPNFRTAEKCPRFLYVFAGVDAATREKRFCFKMSVDGKPNGLNRLWEGHAQRLLEAILANGKMPAEIRVRSGRTMRFLRPLGIHLPFKLSQYPSLPAVENYFKETVSKGGE